MSVDKIRKELYLLADADYRDFQRRLIPTLGPDAIIGVRTPELRKFAKKLIKQDNIQGFLNDLPHRYFEENQLHAFIISETKDYRQCVEEVNRFLPYVDNWATCDQLSPKVFRKNKRELPEQIKYWLDSGKTYTVRFGISMLMRHYLDEDFAPSFPEMVAGIRSDEYYVNMMIAWYFATALAKQYGAILPFVENCRLDEWTHNKTIQKATESFRLAPEQKAYLRSLKIKRMCES